MYPVLQPHTFVSHAINVAECCSKYSRPPRSRTQIFVAYGRPNYELKKPKRAFSCSCMNYIVVECFICTAVVNLTFEARLQTIGITFVIQHVGSLKLVTLRLWLKKVRDPTDPVHE